MGRKTTLKKPLTADATLGADGHCNGGGVGQVGEGGKRLSDLLKNTNDVYKEVTTPQLFKWFESFANNAESGMYYKPTDLNIYRLDRVDSDGLNVYLTDFGTCLNEAVHQKLADLLGSMGVGVETADILLILRAFRYNVSAGIARCGEPDFHTDRHDIIDKTQHWIMHLFGIYAWPTHTNLLDFQPPQGSTLVGLRPLPFNQNHGQPHNPLMQISPVTMRIFPGSLVLPLHHCHFQAKKNSSYTIPTSERLGSRVGI